MTGTTLLRALRQGDRRALARAITLVESSRPDHRQEAERLIEAVLPETAKAVRIGVSGPPGAGKSTFIERFGLEGIALGRQIAVLAVDPASKRGGGAILGDKTRMAELARAPDAFIRPSSAGDSRGGVARRTREAILLCEAAGFDTVLVETVGVGQAETAVAEIVDMFVLILPPAGGDELQGIKRGIVELADLVLVNKADGELAAAAHRSVADYASAMGLIRPPYSEWQVPVRAISALEGTGIRGVWDDVERFQAALERIGAWSQRRAEQARSALWSEIGNTLLDHFRTAPDVARRLTAVEEEVMAGSLTPTAAARQLLASFFGEPCASPTPLSGLPRSTGLTKGGSKA
ncbi:MAG TPA: methylmalonyl Co-A mutase-associated GTPase MeaB [Stellaceae bacterium]|nr:methylmalonyl Co-A mutase-associated GTPase MeaB [Stellaceae bacterium]